MNSTRVYGKGDKRQIGNYLLTVNDGLHCSFDRVPTNHPHLHHGYYELCFVLEGSGIYRHALDSQALRQNDVFLADPDCVHEISSWETRDLQLLFFEFSIAVIGAEDPFEMPASGTAEHILCHFLRSHGIHSSAPFLRHYIPLLPSAIAKARHFGSSHSVVGFVVEALQSLAGIESAQAESVSRDEQFQRAMAYVEGRIREKISLHDVSQASNTSVRHLNRLFKKETGLSPLEVINNKKMNLASKMLLMGWRCQDVGFYLGIEDPGQFSRMFKRYIGENPSSFVRKNRSNRDVKDTLFL